MRAPDDVTNAAGGPSRRRGPMVATVGCLLLVAITLAACASGPTTATNALATPSSSLAARPNYANSCAPIGEDSSNTCVRLTLAAIDAARAPEGLAPMLLPADFARLTVAEQLFVVLDRERVDRGLTPFAGLSPSLDANAQTGAAAANLPPRPGRAYTSVDAEWIGAVDNGLDADYQWLYDDGPNSGVPGCSSSKTSGCWADREIVLQRFGRGNLVMGAAYIPNGDTSPGDRGGSSLAATLAAAVHPGSFVYTWRDALAASEAGTLRPLRSLPTTESNAGVPDPSHNVQPKPDYIHACAGAGVDDAAACINAALAAINHAHVLEGVRPMALPTGFAQLNVAEQLFVVVNLERADRGLPTFSGLSPGLDANAERGADDANDPPDPGPAYVLDDFGSGPNLVMGAAIDTTGDHHSGDNGGTSMAVTLAVAGSPPQSLRYTWSQVLAELPPSSGVPGASG